MTKAASINCCASVLLLGEIVNTPAIGSGSLFTRTGRGDDVAERRTRPIRCPPPCNCEIVKVKNFTLIESNKSLSENKVFNRDTIIFRGDIEFQEKLPFKCISIENENDDENNSNKNHHENYRPTDWRDVTYSLSLCQRRAWTVSCGTSSGQSWRDNGIRFTRLMMHRHDAQRF